MKKILIVEGNLREENQSFTDGGIKTHTESLKDSIAYFTDKIEIDVVNPSSDKNISEKGRHDPCVGIRAVPIGEAMISCVILDHLLMHRAQCG